MLPSVKRVLIIGVFFSSAFLYTRVFSQDATFSDPLNNKSYFHPTNINVLKGFEAGCNYQTNLLGVVPNPQTGFFYFNGSYKINNKVFLGQGFSIMNDVEGKTPQLRTTSFKANLINFKWFYKKNDGLNCENFFNRPLISMGLYAGFFSKSINSSELIFSKQIESWSSTPVSTSQLQMYDSQTRADIGGNIQIRFPISNLFIFNSDTWSGDLSYSVHHLQSPSRNRVANTEASFIIQNQNIILPRYNVLSFYLLNKNLKSQEIFVQYEFQRPIKRLSAGINFFLNSQLSMCTALSSYKLDDWQKNINTLITTINFFPPKLANREMVKSYKLFFTYTSVLSGVGYAPLINKFGSIQVGIKFFRNNDCNQKTNDCPTF